jgi:hypothetical protein
MEWSRRDEIEDPFYGRPHVVILGAGASIACQPQGDRHGRALPDMFGLAALPVIRELLDEAGIVDVNIGFEAAYSQIRATASLEEVADRIDTAVREYFREVEISDEPTIYDHLLLGLRGKDMVATFNWDPLIVQSEMRLRLAGVDDLPTVVFLHGNVAIGVCLDHAVAGLLPGVCHECRAPLEPAPLLYPVTDKNYEDNEFIKYAWDGLRWGLKNAVVVTIFGYRAPESDRAAIREFKRAYGTAEQRQFEQYELIGRPGCDLDALRQRWDAFVHTHHYNAIDDFYDSWIAQHPRRSAEAWYKQYIEANFIDDNPIPRTLDLEETIKWFAELISYEDATAQK